MEVKINIPDNCELIQEGNTYIIKERQKPLPKTWEEFCKNYPIKEDEYCISLLSDVCSISKIGERICTEDRNLCSTKEEAEAFLALIQLRRLRNAWVGDWKPSKEHYSIYIREGEIKVDEYFTTKYILSFPTETMAKEFADCFKDLIMKAKILL